MDNLVQKNEPDTKLNHIFIVKISFCARNATKNETNKSLLLNFCNVFHLLISGTQKIDWKPPVFKPDFYIFSYN